MVELENDRLNQKTQFRLYTDAELGMTNPDVFDKNIIESVS